MLPLKVSGVMIVKTDIEEKENFSSCLMRLEMVNGADQSWMCYFFDETKEKVRKMKLKAGSVVQITADLIQQPSKTDITFEQWQLAFPGKRFNNNPVTMLKVKEIDYAIPISYTQHNNKSATTLPTVKGVFVE